MSRTWFKFALPAALLLAFVRLAWVASRTEIGWEVIGAQWYGATLDAAGLGSLPVSQRDPLDQARFWNEEATRILAAHPDSASLHMGAAWILDAPSINFVRHVAPKRRTISVIPGTITTADNVSIGSLEEEFRSACLDRCLKLAEQATQLDPADVRWWQMRALLLFEGDTIWSGRELSARAPDWFEVLGECRAHDPENALYDYLAAFQLWHQSATDKWQDEPGLNDDYNMLIVHDENMFAEGTRRFVAAQARGSVTIGERGYSAIAEFLAQSSLSRSEQVIIALNRFVTIRQSLLYVALTRWQKARIDRARLAERPEEELQIRQQNFRFYEQVVSADETSATTIRNGFDLIRRFDYRSVEKLLRENIELAPASDLVSLREQDAELRVRSEILTRALKVLSAARNTNKPADFWTGMLLGLALICSSMLLAIGILASLLSVLLSRCAEEQANLGVVRLGIVWVLGMGAAFVVLGMTPAGFISLEVQRNVMTGLFWMAVASVAGGLGWAALRNMRRRRWRYSLSGLFAATTVCALLLFARPALTSWFGFWTELVSSVSVPAKGVYGIEPEVLRSASSMSAGSWTWAFVQWSIHHGQAVGVVVAVLLSIAWYMVRCARTAGVPWMRYWTQFNRPRWAGLCRFLGRSTLRLGACWLLVYLLVVPTTLLRAEEIFQYKMGYCRDPQGLWQKNLDALQQIESSSSEMREIRESVEAAMRGEEVYGPAWNSSP